MTAQLCTQHPTDDSSNVYIMYITKTAQLQYVHNIRLMTAQMCKKRQPQYVPNIQLMTAQLCTKHPIGESPVFTQQAE